MTCVKNYKVVISVEQIANKYLNVCERVKFVGGKGVLPLLPCESSVSMKEKPGRR